VPWSPENSLVIGISSRALFRLDEEDRIYCDHGTQAFIDYQREHEADLPRPGVAFPLVEALLKLNQTLGREGSPAIEVVIISKNHPDCGIRIRRSLKHYDLKIRRAVFTGGQPTLPNLKAFQVDLFLSKEEAAVREAISAGISAGLIYGGPEEPEALDGTPVFAFDGDSVLFSGDADQAFRENNMEGFKAFEFDNITKALPPGPLHKFALALEELRAGCPIDNPPFRIALVTARAVTYSERPLLTLREAGIRVDQSYFLDGMSKGMLLAELRPLIFFDDSVKNCADACAITPTVQILADEAVKTVVTRSSAPGRVSSPERFFQVCKLVLKKTFDEHEPALRMWEEKNLSSLPDERYNSFNDELERSARGTPPGRQRRAAGSQNDDITKLMQFLEQALKKHTSQAS
jgi:5'-nucleotidase